MLGFEWDAGRSRQHWPYELEDALRGPMRHPTAKVAVVGHYCPPQDYSTYYETPYFGEMTGNIWQGTTGDMHLPEGVTELVMAPEVLGESESFPMPPDYFAPVYAMDLVPRLGRPDGDPMGRSTGSSLFHWMATMC